MKIRLIAIVLAAAAFAWGFSALVERSGQAVPPGNPGFACEEWSGEGCGSTLRR